MLKDTLIVWAGEFGRTPMSQGGDGRDHHNKGFTIWLAGGGIKGGLQLRRHRRTGLRRRREPVNVHDLHATMLHLLGIDHTRFTFKFQGLDAAAERRGRRPSDPGHPGVTRLMFGDSVPWTPYSTRPGGDRDTEPLAALR